MLIPSIISPVNIMPGNLICDCSRCLVKFDILSVGRIGQARSLDGIFDGTFKFYGF